MNSLEIIKRKIKELELKIENYELEPKTIINEVKIDNVNKQLNDYKKIKQDLERLEELNEVWHKNEPMESYDINANHLQEIYDFITHLVEENIELRKKIENIKKLPNCCICDENWYKGCMCLQRKIKEVLGNE